MGAHPILVSAHVFLMCVTPCNAVCVDGADFNGIDKLILFRDMGTMLVWVELAVLHCC